MKTIIYDDYNKYDEPSGIFLGDSEKFACPPLCGISRCIRAEKDGAGVLIPMDKIECNYVGMLSGKYENMHDISRRVWDIGAISPTLTAICGGNQETKIAEPIICASRGRNPDNSSDRSAGSPVKQRLEFGGDISNTLTTVQKDNYVAEPYRFYQQAFETLNDNECEKGDTIDAFNKSVNKSGVSPTVTTRPEGFKTAILAVDEQNKTIRDNGVIGCQTTDGSSPKHNNRVAYNYRIRKLTERECFRLMGVRDKDFDKIKDNQSKSSLYHLAGDSIVTTCLMAIFGELTDVDYQSKIKELERDLDQLQ